MLRIQLEDLIRENDRYTKEAIELDEKQKLIGEIEDLDQSVWYYQMILCRYKSKIQIQMILQQLLVPFQKCKVFIYYPF